MPRNVCESASTNENFESMRLLNAKSCTNARCGPYGVATFATPSTDSAGRSAVVEAATQHNRQSEIHLFIWKPFVSRNRSFAGLYKCSTSANLAAVGGACQF